VTRRLHIGFVAPSRAEVGAVVDPDGNIVELVEG
jgi:hypothetical protein